MTGHRRSPVHCRMCFLTPDSAGDTLGGSQRLLTPDRCPDPLPYCAWNLSNGLYGLDGTKAWNSPCPNMRRCQTGAAQIRPFQNLIGTMTRLVIRDQRTRQNMRLIPLDDNHCFTSTINDIAGADL
jgi:hypothetical protein